MSTTIDELTEAARTEIQSREAESRRVEELDDDLDSRAEERLQERLVLLGKRRGITGPTHPSP